MPDLGEVSLITLETPGVSRAEGQRSDHLTAQFSLGGGVRRTFEDLLQAMVAQGMARPNASRKHVK